MCALPISSSQSFETPFCSVDNPLVFLDRSCEAKTYSSENFFRYFPEQSATPEESVRLTGVGRSRVPPGAPYPLGHHPMLYNFNWHRGRTLPEFQLVLISEGSGEFETKSTGRIVFTAPAVLTILPGVWHRYRPLPETGWTEHWLSFDGKSARKLLEDSDTCIQSSASKIAGGQACLKEFDSLLESFRRNTDDKPRTDTHDSWREIVELANQTLGRESFSSADEPRLRLSTNVDDPVVQQALSYIWTDSRGPITVRDVAQQLPVTRRTLDRRFAETLGHSVLEEIINCRMSRAKRLLVATDLPVKNVARLAGFPSSERMRVTFVEGEGVPPLAYRQQNS